jgi:hypothetical protein
MKISVLLVLSALAVTGNIHAQSAGPTVLNAAGGTHVIGTNEFDWSIGEMTLVETFTGNNFVLTQGLLQPAGFSNESVRNNSLLANQLQVFPNPASSVVNIEYSSPVTGTLSYKMIDVAGQTVRSSVVAAPQGKTLTQINVTDLANASYLLEITANTGNSTSESITYKIEKLN